MNKIQNCRCGLRHIVAKLLQNSCGSAIYRAINCAPIALCAPMACLGNFG